MKKVVFLSLTIASIVLGGCGKADEASAPEVKASENSRLQPTGSSASQSSQSAPVPAAGS